MVFLPPHLLNHQVTEGMGPLLSVEYLEVPGVGSVDPYVITLLGRHFSSCIATGSKMDSNMRCGTGEGEPCQVRSRYLNV